MISLGLQDQPIGELYRPRVARGVARLDVIVPDWPAKVFGPDIEMQYDARCVLGQVFGSYSDTRDAWDWTTGQMIEHGFTIGSDVFDNWANWDRHWRVLGCLWDNAAELRRRKV